MPLNAHHTNEELNPVQYLPRSEVAKQVGKQAHKLCVCGLKVDKLCVWIKIPREQANKLCVD